MALECVTSDLANSRNCCFKQTEDAGTETDLNASKYNGIRDCFLRPPKTNTISAIFFDFSQQKYVYAIEIMVQESRRLRHDT